MRTLEILLVLSLASVASVAAAAAKHPALNGHCQNYLGLGTLSGLSAFLANQLASRQVQTVFVEVRGRPLVESDLDPKLELYGGKLGLAKESPFVLSLTGSPKQLIPTLMEVQFRFGPDLVWVDYSPRSPIDMALVEQDFVEENYSTNVAPGLVLTRDSNFFRRRFEALEAEVGKFGVLEIPNLKEIGTAVGQAPLRVKAGEESYFLVSSEIFKLARALRNQDLLPLGAAPATILTRPKRLDLSISQWTQQRAFMKFQQANSDNLVALISWYRVTGWMALPLKTARTLGTEGVKSLAKSMGTEDLNLRLMESLTNALRETSSLERVSFGSLTGKPGADRMLGASDQNRVLLARDKSSGTEILILPLGTIGTDERRLDPGEAPQPL